MSQHLAADFPDVWGSALRWHGPRPREALAEARSNADCAIIASDWESFSYAAVEAMAHNLPCVVSSGAGVSAWVQPGEDALVFPAGDAIALGDALVSLAQSPQLRHRMGHAAGTRARAFFSRTAATADFVAHALLFTAAQRETPAPPPTLTAALFPAWLERHTALRRQRASVTSAPELVRILLRRLWNKLSRRSREPS